jgi:hypothetical protein
LIPFSVRLPPLSFAKPIATPFSKMNETAIVPTAYIFPERNTSDCFEPPRGVT